MCGARGAPEGPCNIGDFIVEAMRELDWVAIGDDCAIGDGSRPPGGNLPDDAVARAHGYTVTSRGRYQRFAAPPVSTFEREQPDALVVTLGTTYKDHFSEIADWEIDRVIKANLILPLEAARRYVYARKGQGGSIVFIGSYAHDHPFTNGTLYCAAKAGLAMAARCLGWELTGFGLGYSVHIVHPYHVQGTPMWEQVERDVMASKGLSWAEADAYNRKDLLMPDLLTAAEVAEVVATLLDQPVMRWTSGQEIKLYGGTR